MSVFVKSLFYAIPAFMILMLLEIIVARIKGVRVNRQADMISSLSSGITNTIKDALKFGVVIISYAWLADHITIYTLEPLWLAILFAFIVEDFAGYWMHRLHHRVNVFWNRHIIHHSSEEFNLSCALRQSISITFKFSAILMIPAALLGIPAPIFAVLGPVHLFMQFWYHTTLINKMGILEYIIVTPSHHRVHHAINPEYLDKNYSQIFIIWDKLFNTFQPELDDVKPVYGTLRPVSTWNPIIINFKHILQISKDAWYTRNMIDKLKIWFMPTGWRPDDVKERFPLKEIKNPYDRVKYTTHTSPKLVAWSWVQFSVTFFMMFHLFLNLSGSSVALNYLYAIFILMHVFSFTTTLDQSRYMLGIEFVKLLGVFALLFYQEYSWFNLHGAFIIIFPLYFITSFLLTFYFYRERVQIS